MSSDCINECYFGDFTSAVQRNRDRIHWICREAEGPTVLDIGCSQGIACLILAREGFHCVGVDNNPVSVEYARSALAKESEMVRDRISFELLDATSIPFPNHSFDSVILGEILEHLIRPERVLAEAFRVLKPGGKAVITVPHGLNAFPDHKKTYYPVSLLQLILPWFEPESVITTESYIYCSGRRREQPVPKFQPDYTMLLRLEGELEARCLAREIALLDSGKESTRRTAAINQKLTELREAVQTKDRELAEARAALRTAAEHRDPRREQQLLDTIASQDAELRQLRSTAADREAALQNALTAAQAEIENLQLSHQAETEETAARERDLTAAVAQLRQQADRLAQSHAELKEELERQEAQHRKAVADKDREIAQIQAHWKDVVERLRKAEQDAATRRLAEERRVREIENLRALARTAVPSSATVAVISKGDDDLLAMHVRKAVHFPQTADGVYAGHHPAGSQEAIAHLEELRAAGADYLILPGSSFWWLDYYHEFAQHLGARYRLVGYQEDAGAIYALQEAPGGRKPIVAFNAGRQTAPSGSHPSAVAKRNGKPATVLEVAAVLDEFTGGCLAPECRLITFRPDNWKSTIQDQPLDMLFVESAWRANGGSWQYQIASYPTKPPTQLPSLVEHCKARGIPTVFWNKEDPSSFERFIEKAALFDYVFTTDSDCIPRYREELQHDRVFALPFAAQPAIHNPIQDERRQFNVCFAGAYYGTDFDQRRRDMEHILRPALDFGLHIYDRQHGVTGPLADQFRFPDIYQPAIRGRLEYDQMVRAYKQYRVFLNVNSVTTSPTMCSRRVFELLASGTPVVSSYARAIEDLLGSDVVLMSDSAQETQRILERLLTDEAEWLRVSVRGMRAVLERHTYSERLAEVARHLHLQDGERRPARLTGVARVRANDGLQRLAEILAGQSRRPAALMLLVNDAVDRSRIDGLRRALPGTTIESFPDSAESIDSVCANVSEGYLWPIRTMDAYGREFVRDLVLATRYTSAEVLGKATYFGLNGADTPKLFSLAPEFARTRIVAAGGFIVRASAQASPILRNALFGHEAQLSVPNALALDRFNYVQGRPDLMAVACDRRTQS